MTADGIKWQTFVETNPPSEATWNSFSPKCYWIQTVDGINMTYFTNLPCKDCTTSCYQKWDSTPAISKSHRLLSIFVFYSHAPSKSDHFKNRPNLLLHLTGTLWVSMCWITIYFWHQSSQIYYLLIFWTSICDFCSQMAMELIQLAVKRPPGIYEKHVKEL